MASAGGAFSADFSARLLPDGKAGLRAMGFGGVGAFFGGAGFGGGGGGAGFRSVSSCSTRTGAFVAISFRARGTLGGAGGRDCAVRANGAYFVSRLTGGGAGRWATGAGAFESAVFAAGRITTGSAIATGGASTGFGGGASGTAGARSTTGSAGGAGGGGGAGGMGTASGGTGGGAGGVGAASGGARGGRAIDGGGSTLGASGTAGSARSLGSGAAGRAGGVGSMTGSGGSTTATGPVADTDEAGVLETAIESAGNSS